MPPLGSSANAAASFCETRCESDGGSLNVDQEEREIEQPRVEWEMMARICFVVLEICMKRLLGVIVFVAVMAATPAASRARDATPASGDSRRVSAEFCTIAPRSVDSLQKLVEVRSTDGTDIRIPIRFAPGEGEPADVLTIDAVTSVMNQLAACYNAGDLLRIYGLFTDNALIPALLPEDVAAAAVATPLPITSGSLYVEPTVWDVRVQPDGRVTAMVEFNGELALITFAWDGEQYLIDLFDDQIVGTATPVPGA